MRAVVLANDGLGVDLASSLKRGREVWELKGKLERLEVVGVGPGGKELADC